jgi:hypothetical protein
LTNVIWNSQSEIAEREEVSSETHTKVIDRIAKIQLEQRKFARDNFLKVNKIMGEHSVKIKQLLGDANYKDFRKLIAEEDKKLSTKLLSPIGPSLTMDKRMEIVKDRDKSLVDFLNQKNIDIKEMKKIDEKFRKQIDEVLKPEIPEKDGKPVQILHTKDVPEEIVKETFNPWTIKTPPFSGWSWQYNGYVSGFSFFPTLYLNAASGLVGNKNYLRDRSASDFDYGFVTYDVLVGFWYKMPKAGMLEVYIKAQNSFNEHYCSLSDEWGISDSSNYQYNYLILDIVDPDSDIVSSSRMSWWYETGYNNGHWVNSYLTEGNDYWAHLYSDIPFAKDKWVYVLVGTRTYNYAFANDVKVYAHLLFKWFIEKVYIKVL